MIREGGDDYEGGDDCEGMDCEGVMMERRGLGSRSVPHCG